MSSTQSKSFKNLKKITAGFSLLEDRMFWKLINAYTVIDMFHLPENYTRTQLSIYHAFYRQLGRNDSTGAILKLVDSIHRYLKRYYDDEKVSDKYKDEIIKHRNNFILQLVNGVYENQTGI